MPQGIVAAELPLEVYTRRLPLGCKGRKLPQSAILPLPKFLTSGGLAEAACGIGHEESRRLRQGDRKLTTQAFSVTLGHKARVFGCAS